MARYGKKAQEKVEKVMRERKRGTLRSGRSGNSPAARSSSLSLTNARLIGNLPSGMTLAQRAARAVAGGHPDRGRGARCLILPIQRDCAQEGTFRPGQRGFGPRTNAKNTCHATIP